MEHVPGPPDLTRALACATVQYSCGLLLHCWLAPCTMPCIYCPLDPASDYLLPPHQPHHNTSTHTQYNTTTNKPYHNNYPTFCSVNNHQKQQTLPGHSLVSSCGLRPGVVGM